MAGFYHGNIRRQWDNNVNDVGNMLNSPLLLLLGSFGNFFWRNITWDHIYSFHKQYNEDWHKVPDMKAFWHITTIFRITVKHPVSMSSKTLCSSCTMQIYRSNIYYWQPFSCYPWIDSLRRTQITRIYTHNIQIKNWKSAYHY